MILGVSISSSHVGTSEQVSGGSRRIQSAPKRASKGHVHASTLLSLSNSRERNRQLLHLSGCNHNAAKMRSVSYVLLFRPTFFFPFIRPLVTVPFFSLSSSPKNFRSFPTMLKCAPRTHCFCTSLNRPPPLWPPVSHCSALWRLIHTRRFLNSSALPSCVRTWRRCWRRCLFSFARC
jgi:hypothetical protein